MCFFPPISTTKNTGLPFPTAPSQRGLFLIPDLPCFSSWPLCLLLRLSAGWVQWRGRRHPFPSCLIVEWRHYLGHSRPERWGPHHPCLSSWSGGGGSVPGETSPEDPRLLFPPPISLASKVGISLSNSERSLHCPHPHLQNSGLEILLRRRSSS